MPGGLSICLLINGRCRGSTLPREGHPWPAALASLVIRKRFAIVFVLRLPAEGAWKSSFGYQTKAAFVLSIQLCSMNALLSVHAALGPRLLAHLAVGEEGVGHYLARLSSGCARARAEVRQVVGSAWLPCSSARIAVDDASITQSPDEVIEG